MEEALQRSASPMNNASHHAHQADEGLLASDDGGSDDPPPVRIQDEDVIRLYAYTDACP